ncbi:MAG: flotillin family protein, partial [Clostridia bacterium]|nr:flotillin family protein [Clostridia bacterium]
WDNGGTGENGKTSTANFVSGLMKSVPPLNEIFDMAGMQLPEYLGKKAEDASADAPAEETNA